MNNEEIVFNAIVEKFTGKDTGITFGKMMSSPALKFRDKVFAFFYEGKMCFKLGQEFDARKHDLHDVELLSPFKTKAPLNGWFVVKAEDMHKWELLAEKAFKRMASGEK